jgi:hypothetical protein
MKRSFAALISIVFIAVPALAQNDSPAGAPVRESAKATSTAEEKELIPETRWPQFRGYIVQQAVPSYTYSSDLTVGTVLPEQGVTYYDVPADYGPTRYRYTVVNSQPVLVEPSSRRVVQIIR